MVILVGPPGVREVLERVRVLDPHAGLFPSERHVRMGAGALSPRGYGRRPCCTRRALAARGNTSPHAPRATQVRGQLRRRLRLRWLSVPHSLVGGFDPLFITHLIPPPSGIMHSIPYDIR